ncbi:MAG: heavy-metal-associated domain-containing protein [Propionibacteriaceae bacterium]|jgi:copper chaperone CopZ|nr:heavy-metal-associated domain-containing protein [Propionibacteriaceae bacterium]
MENTYHVAGMTCQHCVAHVTAEVEAIPGVDQVAVDLTDGSLRIISATPIDFAAIQAAVAEAGDYTVSVNDLA